MRRERRRGVTLLELVVALALGALVLVGAYALLGTISDAGTRARRRAVASDDRGLGLSLLRRGLRTATSRESGTGAFFGDSSAMSFSARCGTGGGWDRPCRIDVRIATRPDSAHLVLSEPGREDRILVSATGGLSFRYLRTGPLGEDWLASWTQSVARPAAVALVGRRDTALLLVATP